MGVARFGSVILCWIEVIADAAGAEPRRSAIDSPERDMGVSATPRGWGAARGRRERLLVPN